MILSFKTELQAYMPEVVTLSAIGIILHKTVLYLIKKLRSGPVLLFTAGSATDQITVEVVSSQAMRAYGTW